MGAIPYDEDPKVLAYRVGRQETQLKELGDWRREVDDFRTETKGEVHGLTTVTGNLQKSVDGLRKTLLAFAFTIAGSAVVFAFSVLVATGKL